ncbi:Protein of unknown function DUF761 [Macleaya cordata]|uniref:DUF4408 domain-containing protein n=1 Tax=Macleaya cordata TaxID=56857 RepID=A0A200QD78_MACCD|nr:Protein of unknown function DUF761 [Macleaya cordata]
MASWFTPTFLFLLLNLVIGIIAVTSAFGSHKHKNQQQQLQQQPRSEFHQQPPPLARAPSSVLDRLKSINLYHFRSEDLNPFPSITTSTYQPPESIPVTSGFVTQNNQGEGFHEQPQLARAPSILERLKSINLYHFKTEDFNPFPTIDTTESSEIQHQKQVLKPTQVRKQSRNQKPDYDFLNHRALNHKNKQRQQQAEEFQQHQPRQQLARAPSILERLKSINLYNFKPEDLNPFPTIKTEPVNQHQKTVLKPTQVRKESRDQNPDHDFLDHRALNKNKSTHQHQKTVSKPTQVRKEPQQQDPDHDFLDHRALNKNKSARTTRPPKMKLVSAKSHIGHYGEVEDMVFDDEPRRPSTVKENKSKASEVDEEVDAKADDFINRFKQQLKLQRLDSILQYKDFLSRGAGK